MQTDDQTGQGIYTRRNGKFAHIQISNPAKRNAMSLQMWLDLATAISTVDSDPEIRVIILSGAGEKAFVSGADISLFESERTDSTDGEHYSIAMEGAIGRLAASPKPVVAAIRGACIGGGVDLALGADIRICTEDAFFCIPAARIGLAYKFTSLRRLSNTIGGARAREMLLTAERISARQALQINLVTRLASTEQFEAVLDNEISRLASNAPLSIKAAKFGLSILETDSSDSRIADHNAMVAAATDSDDYREGVQAFKEKRQPVFGGQ